MENLKAQIQTQQVLRYECTVSNVVDVEISPTSITEYVASQGANPQDWKKYIASFIKANGGTDNFLSGAPTPPKENDFYKGVVEEEIEGVKLLG